MKGRTGVDLARGGVAKVIVRKKNIKQKDTGFKKKGVNIGSWGEKTDPGPTWGEEKN